MEENQPEMAERKFSQKKFRQSSISRCNGNNRRIANRKQSHQTQVKPQSHKMRGN